MKKILILFSLFLIFSIYLFVLFVRVTDDPEFCKNCHFMKGFYENWLTSTHNTVPCYKCHYGPTFKDYLGGKVRLFGEIIRYFAGVYNTEIQTKVKDEVCLSCHKKEDYINRKLKLKGKNVYFTHLFHLDENKIKFKFNCQNCHSELVQGSHTAISQKVCFLCHFIGGDFEARGECTTCHHSPAEELLIWGVPFKHSDYIKVGINCQTCHRETTTGRGDVDSERCKDCHLKPTFDFKNYKKIHEMHVNFKNISCFKCHEEIKHGKFSTFQVFSPVCQECHGNTHLIQEKIYSGVGGIDVPSLPDRMFLAGVICQGCHKAELKKTDLGIHFGIPKAKPSSCISCHGKKFDKLLLRWQSLIKKRIELIKKKEKIYSVLREFGILNYNKRKVDLNLLLIEEDKSFGAHNIKYVNLLLDEVERELKIETKKPTLEKIYSENSECINCHFGIENSVINFKDREFTHGPHLFKNSCITCHFEVKPSEVSHGKLKEVAEDCNSCHHMKNEKDCEKCHEIQKKFYSGEYLSSSPDYMKNAEIGCVDCHLQNRFIVKPSPSVCSNCHERDYEENFKKDLDSIKREISNFEVNVHEILKKIKSKKEIEIFYKFLKDYEKFKIEGSFGSHNLIFMREFLDKIKMYNNLRG
ncbi:MAG: cytochrome c3 family protein [Candidatus Hydrothermales bacterium]